MPQLSPKWRIADKLAVASSMGPSLWTMQSAPWRPLKREIISDVASYADILLAPDLEASNLLAKQLIYLASADAAGIIVGARVPIVLTSRADTERARFISCAIAVLLANARISAQATAIGLNHPGEEK